MPTSRTVLPELLDHLAPDDPMACGSRRDLQRIHLAMRTLHALRSAIRQLGLKPPQRLLELGAGDGTLLLRLARVQASIWPAVALTLLDQQDLVSAQTRAGYEALGWRVTVLKTDVLDWVRSPSSRYDLCLTSLFLHHFAGQELASIMAAVAARCDAFVACEPRRDSCAYMASRLVGVTGANRVTRADAVSSVAAGFRDRELSHAWPDAASWILHEARALPFGHCFAARARFPVSGVGA